MIYLTVCIVLIFAGVLWWLNGFFSNRMAERDKQKDDELQAYYESMSDNKKADDDSDGAIDRRVRDKYSHR